MNEDLVINTTGRKYMLQLSNHSEDKRYLVLCPLYFVITLQFLTQCKALFFSLIAADLRKVCFILPCSIVFILAAKTTHSNLICRKPFSYTIL